MQLKVFVYKFVKLFKLLARWNLLARQIAWILQSTTVRYCQEGLRFIFKTDF